MAVEGVDSMLQIHVKRPTAEPLEPRPERAETDDVKKRQARAILPILSLCAALGGAATARAETPPPERTVYREQSNVKCERAFIERILLPAARERYLQTDRAAKEGILARNSLGNLLSNGRTRVIKQKQIDDLATKFQAALQEFNGHSLPILTIENGLEALTWAKAAFETPVFPATSLPVDPTAPATATTPPVSSPEEVHTKFIEATHEKIVADILKIKRYPEDVRAFTNRAAEAVMERMVLEEIQRTYQHELEREKSHSAASPNSSAATADQMALSSRAGFYALIPQYEHGDPPTISGFNRFYYPGLAALKAELGELRKQEAHALHDARDRSVEQALMIRRVENFLHDFHRQASLHDRHSPNLWPERYRDVVYAMSSIFRGEAHEANVLPEFNPPEWAWNQLTWRTLSNELYFTLHRKWDFSKKLDLKKFSDSINTLTAEEKKALGLDKLPLAAIGAGKLSPFRAVLYLSMISGTAATLYAASPVQFAARWPVPLEFKAEAKELAEQRVCAVKPSQEEFESCAEGYMVAHFPGDVLRRYNLIGDIARGTINDAPRIKQKRDQLLKERTDFLKANAATLAFQKEFRERLNDTNPEGAAYRRTLTHEHDEDAFQKLMLDPESGYLALRHPVPYALDEVREASRDAVTAVTPKERTAALARLTQLPQATELAKDLRQLLAEHREALIVPTVATPHRPQAPDATSRAEPPVKEKTFTLDSPDAPVEVLEPVAPSTSAETPAASAEEDSSTPPRTFELPDPPPKTFQLDD
jgi:hypothetical protein